MITTTLACSNYLCLEKDIRALDQGGSDWFHIDIMDGHFVPNLCLNFDMVTAIRSISSTPMDVHLMVKNPLEYVEIMARNGIEASCTHMDTDDDIEQFLNALEKHGIKKGIALAPKDPVEEIFPYLPYLDFVLLLYVEPGFSGQQFKPEILKKLDTLAARREEQNLDFVIEADGGVGWHNAEELIARGTDLLVAGAFANYDGKGPLECRTAEFKKLCETKRVL